jgi:uncharacterized protein (TIGR02271 family)
VSPRKPRLQVSFETVSKESGVESTREEVVVYGRGGLRGTANLDDPSPGHVRVHLDEGGDFVLPADALAARDDGAYELPFSRDQLAALRQGEEWSEASAVVPLVEETLQVGKRKVETGKTTVRKLVHEREEVVDLSLTKEEVDVERVPVNRYVDGYLETRQEGDVTIIPVVEEVLVVEKRFLLKEEVRIVRRREEEPYRQTFTLRQEEVQVERHPPEPDAPVR